MKKQFKKWTFRLSVTGLLLLGLLILFMLNPILLYANKTEIENQSIYHNQPLDKNFQLRLQQANTIIKSSELFDPNLKIDIGLKDGSAYPKLVEAVLGKDFISSFYNKNIFGGDTISFTGNYIVLGEHKWNLTQMLAHAEVHCLQFNKYGLWHSNPIAKYPTWKWEGYPEYIARQSFGEKKLKENIAILIGKQPANNNDWMTLPGNTETLIAYYEYRLLIQFCIEIKKNELCSDYCRYNSRRNCKATNDGLVYQTK